MSVIATITGPSGWETCNLSLIRTVAKDGALDGVPVVTVEGDSSAVSLGSPLINDTQQVVGGVTHAAGTLLSFTVTSTSSSLGDIPLKIVVTTAKRERTFLRDVRKIRADE